MYARPFIDSSDFAKNGREISGAVKIADMPRLLDMVESAEGIFTYTVQGGVDHRGSSYLDVHVAGWCRLLCQRCLQGLDYPVDMHTRLLLRDQASLDALDHGSGEEEEFDSILADTHLDVWDMLEDEILLSLPFAPKHEPKECQAVVEEAIEEVAVKESDSPFAVLAKLKRS
jgi:uncharacterized protein